MSKIRTVQCTITWLLICSLFSIGYSSNFGQTLHLTNLGARPKRGLVILVPTTADSSKAFLKNLRNIDEIHPSETDKYIHDAALKFLTPRNNNNILHTTSQKDSLKPYLHMLSVINPTEIPKRQDNARKIRRHIQEGHKPRGTRDNKYTCHCQESQCLDNLCNPQTEAMSWKTNINEDEDASTEVTDHEERWNMAQPTKVRIPVVNSLNTGQSVLATGSDEHKAKYRILPVYQGMPIKLLEDELYSIVVPQDPSTVFFDEDECHGSNICELSNEDLVVQPLRVFSDEDFYGQSVDHNNAPDIGLRNVFNADTPSTQMDTPRAGDQQQLIDRSRSERPNHSLARGDEGFKKPSRAAPKNSPNRIESTEIPIQSVDQKPKVLRNQQTQVNKKDEVRLQCTVKRVLNNFVPGRSRDLMANKGNAADIDVEDLLPEILETPALRSLLVTSEVEDMVVQVVGELLGQTAVEDRSIRKVLREVVRRIPIRLTVTPSGEELSGGQWVSEHVVVPEKSGGTPREVFEKIRCIIRDSGIRMSEVALPVVRNVIVKAVKRALDRERGVADEFAIRRAFDCLSPLKVSDEIEPVDDEVEIGNSDGISGRSTPRSGVDTMARKLPDDTSKNADSVFLGKILTIGSKQMYVGDGVRLPVTVKKQPNGALTLTLAGEMGKRDDYPSHQLASNEDGRITREIRDGVVVPRLSFADDEVTSSVESISVQRARRESGEMITYGTKTAKEMVRKKVDGNKNTRISTRCKSQDKEESRNREKNRPTSTVKTLLTDQTNNYSISEIGAIQSQRDGKTTDTSAPYKYQRQANENTHVLKNVLYRMKNLLVDTTSRQ